MHWKQPPATKGLSSSDKINLKKSEQGSHHLSKKLKPKSYISFEEYSFKPARNNDSHNAKLENLNIMTFYKKKQSVKEESNSGLGNIRRLVHSQKSETGPRNGDHPEYLMSERKSFSHKTPMPTMGNSHRSLNREKLREALVFGIENRNPSKHSKNTPLFNSGPSRGNNWVNNNGEILCKTEKDFNAERSIKQVSL